MRELWRRIKGIFNAGQEEYELCEGSSGDDADGMDLYRCFKIGTDNSGTSYVCTIDSGMALIGFLLSREYGFAEAWKEYHGILDYKTREVLVDGINATNQRERVFADPVEWFLLCLAIAVDKDEWLGENL